jgi:hypothetical protein
MQALKYEIGILKKIRCAEKMFNGSCSGFREDQCEVRP